ncbi:cardiolipin synthase [Roseiconus nitratireducens]|uniref:Cardiolipin synthase n=1 Tax=Roseiconus nitratireducens TaxID=2605748 RepID=A0A5M6DBM0_9BACT|nr:cardiolipin synthase [Roseiconus nitratireducens]
MRVLVFLVAHLLGAISSVQAIMSTRTAQGAIAWAISLNTFPYVAVPAYWVFGRSKFDGYHMKRHATMLAESETERNVIGLLAEGGMLIDPKNAIDLRRKTLLENLAQMPVTRFNDADLLIDGEATFDAIVEGITEATDYVLFQFYIIHDDDLGNRLKDALIAKAKEGVSVFFLYDALGSYSLPDAYLSQLRDAGVQTAAFRTTRGWQNRFRVNFRNHRKIVVIDGKEAFVGGHNVGDEYLGKDDTLTPWRDTHVAVRGPTALEAQVTFVEDWSWATGNIPELNWEPHRAPQGDVRALCLPTGPADNLETGTLMLLDLINSSTESIWIATPYFAPDQQFVSALQLASLRGVDVRILVPEQYDNFVVGMTVYSYLEELEETSIKFHWYERGFMHQKVILVDGKTAAIGTANFDNRSMRLNFEVTMLLEDAEFAASVEQMLETDFQHSRLASAAEYRDGSLPFRFAVRVCRLFAPIQ